MFFVNKNKLDLDERYFQYVYKDDSVEWYIDGTLYYLIHPKDKKLVTCFDSKTLNRVFKSCDYNPYDIKQLLEGHYIFIIKKDDKILLFGDYFNRKNLFYVTIDDLFLFDTVLSKNLINNCNGNLNNMFLMSYMKIGYSHASETLYEDIHRLSFQQYIEIKDGKMGLHYNFTPNLIHDYDTSMLRKFEKLFIESVKSRVDESGSTWLMASSGWDSTIILDTLVKILNKKKIHTATFEVLFRNGDCLNSFEVEKIKDISRHYDVDNHSYIVDLDDKKLVDMWKKYAHTCFENHVFQWPINQLGVINHIKKSDPYVKSIFNGEAADSMQNFGFSQYGSIHIGDNDFDEYADKMKTYLYGGTFYKKFLDGSFKDDKIYNIFKSINKGIRFYDNEPYSNVMMSFIYSPSRLPFTIPSGFYDEIFDRHFKKYYDILNPYNIYSIWNALYADYHFKGSTIPLNIVGIESVGCKPALPFFDLRLSRFFNEMPESWGRGLNWNRLKYPEKTMAFRSRTFPLDIVERKIPHSYIYEKDDKIDDKYEYYVNSSIGDYFKDIFEDGDFIWLKKISCFIDSKINSLDFVIRLGTLQSIMMEGLK